MVSGVQLHKKAGDGHLALVQSACTGEQRRQPTAPHNVRAAPHDVHAQGESSVSALGTSLTVCGFVADLADTPHAVNCLYRPLMFVMKMSAGSMLHLLFYMNIICCFKHEYFISCLKYDH